MDKKIIHMVCLLLAVTLLHAKAFKHWRHYGGSGHPYGRCLKNGRIVPCRYNPGPNGYYPTTYKPRPKWPMKKTTTTTTTTAVPTTTTTTEEPETEESKKIREMYLAAQELSSENLFALTRPNADNFTSRIFDEVIASNEQCNRTLPKFTDCKIKELTHILNEYPCTFEGNNDTVSGMTRMAAVSGRSQRRRRETTQNSDGSVSIVKACVTKASRSRNNNLRLCSQCFVETDLGETRFPRYINEVTCNSADRQCLSTTGICIENTITLTFISDDNNVGLTRLDLWVQYPQAIRTGCGCQVAPESVIAGFV